MHKLDSASKDSSRKCQSTDSKWDKAIDDASHELVQAERKVSRLQAALRIFRENKVKGVPWPGDGRVIGQREP